MLSIGLMSGTSMDGIDAALLKTDGETHIQELGHASIDYDPEFKILLKTAEYAVRSSKGDLEAANRHCVHFLEDYLTHELHQSSDQMRETQKTLADYVTKRLNYPSLNLLSIIQHSTDLHAAAVRKLLNKTDTSPEKIDVVGYHGQTLFHAPALKCSVIVGDGQHLANQLGITVVNDFRRADLEHGGQGAPLAPLYHYALAMRDQKIPLAVVNCGGIANITFINNSNMMDLLAFDTGPGNGLIDRLIRQRTNGLETMDKDGVYGKKGKINPEVIQALYEQSLSKNNQNYFSLRPPKALDIGDLNLISELQTLSLEDACATLEAFTADTIVHSVQWSNTVPHRWILAGGGWNNPVIYYELKKRLQQRLGDTLQLLRAEEAGWNSQALEAQVFAYLAVRSLQNKPLSVPGTTQVSHPCPGGCIFRAEKQ